MRDKLLTAVCWIVAVVTISALIISDWAVDGYRAARS